MTARTLARAGMTVAGAYFISRVLGWVRIVVITNEFHAGTELDAYFAAFRLPDAIFQLVAAGALSSAMIPVLAGLFHRDEEDHAWRVVSTVLNILLIALVGAGRDRGRIRAGDRAHLHARLRRCRHRAHRSG